MAHPFRKDPFPIYPSPPTPPEDPIAPVGLPRLHRQRPADPWEHAGPRPRSCLRCGLVVLLVVLGLLATVVMALAQTASPHPSPRESGRPRIETVQGRLVLIPAEGETEDKRSEMMRWLKRWERGSTPLTEARRRLARALVTHHPTRLEEPCRGLGEALTKLDRETLLPAPDYAVHRHLTRHLDHLARAVSLCLVGYTTATGAEMRRATRAESEFQLALGRWGLETGGGAP